MPPQAQPAAPVSSQAVARDIYKACISHTLKTKLAYRRALYGSRKSYTASCLATANCS